MQVAPQAPHPVRGLAEQQDDISPAPKARPTPVPMTDVEIINDLCDLFAGRTKTAFGEPLGWWAETFQCDLDTKDAAGVVLMVISKWPCDQRVAAEGVEQLEAELIKRARQCLARGAQP